MAKCKPVINSFMQCGKKFQMFMRCHIFDVLHLGYLSPNFLAISTA